MVVPNTKGANLVDEIQPNDHFKMDAELLLDGEFQQIDHHEWVMYKPRWGAFFGTNLEQLLKGKEINTLVICGCNFPNCPRTTIYQASERDLRVVLASDAISQIYPKGIEEMRTLVSEC